MDIHGLTFPSDSRIHQASWGESFATSSSRPEASTGIALDRCLKHRIVTTHRIAASDEWRSTRGTLFWGIWKSDDHLFGNCISCQKTHFWGISDDIFWGKILGTIQESRAILILLILKFTPLLAFLHRLSNEKQSPNLLAIRVTHLSGAIDCNASSSWQIRWVASHVYFVLICVGYVWCK